MLFPEKIKQSLQLFRKGLDGRDPLFFHSFLCPVAIAEAMVLEHIIEDYDALELLVLRLYEAGFRSADRISSLSGMDRRMVEQAIQNECAVYRHIDSSTKEITPMGYATLEASRGGRPINHVEYHTPRRMQIEAATGTVIPAWLEEKLGFMEPIPPEGVDYVVPQESVEQDEELVREINARISEYKHLDILNAGNTIRAVERINSTRICYRQSYLTQFEGMKYPMVAMRGFRREKGQSGPAVVPLAVSKTDNAYLEQIGLHFPGVIVREDSKFEYLARNVTEFDLSRCIDSSCTDEDMAGDITEGAGEDALAEEITESMLDTAQEHGGTGLAEGNAKK